MNRYFIVLLFSTILFSCGVKQEDKGFVSETKQPENLVANFIYGLWSMDSGNTLYNEGFFFRPDGTVDFIGSDMSGKWELKGNDSLIIAYHSFRTFTTDNGMKEEQLHIDSISESKMILSDASGKHLFRKVPFGMNNEGNVIQGFAGEIGSGEKKNYSVNLPSAKKVGIKLSADSAVLMRIYDEREELTQIPVSAWTSIIVKGGKYRIEVLNSGRNELRYDVKVLLY